MRYILPILTLVLITGCGSKGPLYLPEEDAAAEKPAASQGTEQEPFPGPVEEQEDDVDINL